MKQKAWLEEVLAFFLAEDGAPKAGIPKSYAERRRLLRALMNVRPPSPVPPAVLAAQDKLLQWECREKGIVTVESLPTVADVFSQCAIPHARSISLWRGDITRLATDAIVNAANSLMLGCMQALHDCIDNAIHSAAGVQLRQACYDMMSADYPEGIWSEPVGQARMTDAFNLPCRKVIHTVGPIVSGPLTAGHCALLASSYASCLESAVADKCASIAFCGISTGVFGFPKREAADIAIRTTIQFLNEHPGSLQRVVFDVFSEGDHAIYHRSFRSYPG
jgi:O-acetyl-ADP-ribose deacetylase (regulator of RNase III)